MSKTIIESKSTNTLAVVDGQTGEVLQEETHTQVASKTIHGAEPPYIKLYLQDMLYMSDLPKSYSGLVYTMLKRSSYANDEEGLCVTLAQYTKEKILKECGWDKMQSLNNALNKLVKGNVIKRLGTGVYQFNPYLFGRGEWKDIDNIRLTWNYDAIKGKTFSTSFTYNSSVVVDETVEETVCKEEIA